MTRTAEEIGRTTAGPRPLPALGATREVPLPDVVDTTLPNGLRVLAAHRPGIPMVELRLRVPFAGTRPSTRPSPSCSRRPCSPAPRPATA